MSHYQIIRARYSVPWGTLCHGDNCDTGANGTRSLASFDNIALCLPCWRDHPEWAPGVAAFGPWETTRYRSRWPMVLRRWRYARRRR
jgi:hypothetical protein